jgi:hypothetical protein
MKAYPAVRIEGGLFSADLPELVFSEKLPGQKPADFGLKARSLVNEVAAAFAHAQEYWRTFQSRLQRLPEQDTATSLTREAWVGLLLGLLDYTLSRNTSSYAVDGQTFAISHRADEHEDAPPIHVVGYRQELDKRGRERLSPHALMQEFLNRSEHLWGIVTNGRRLRLLRDSTYVRKQAYLEFDLEQIFEERRFEEFLLLYRLLHRSRLPRTSADAHQCLLEQYYQYSLQQGGRVRNRLRDGVEQCLKLLGNGFLQASGSKINLSAEQMYHQLLHLVYRFLFLLVSEERGLMGSYPVYLQHYSISRLRRLVDNRAAYTEHDDLWQSLRVLWHVLRDENLAAMLNLSPLNGDLFAHTDLEDATITNRDLLEAFTHLVYYPESPSSPPRRVNYAALDTEELGSVYESLLELQPVYRGEGYRRTFDLTTGSERKSTGSYYTPPELVEQLIRSALEPVLRERLSDAKRSASELQRVASGEWRVVYREILERYGETHGHSILSRLGSLAERYGAGRADLPAHPELPARGTLRTDQPNAPSGNVGSPASLWSSLPPATRHSLLAAALAEDAILSLRVLDPACGSGHFLLAAARRLGKELARIRTGEEEPPPPQVREAIRDVVAHCIYGVDKNPLAVELCKVALWLESHTEGKPLTFLDHRIRCGDSLVGVLRLNVLQQGIPDEAFAPVSGESKRLASILKRVNRQERSGQLTLHFIGEEQIQQWADALERLVETPNDTPEQIRLKQSAFTDWERQTNRLRTLCHLWTAAFFQRLTSDIAPGESSDAQGDYITTGVLRRYIDTGVMHGKTAALVHSLAQMYRFFHWAVEFTEVFGEGGFDVVLSNPPWERIKLQEEEFFATRDRSIADAPNAAARKRLIAQLQRTNPTLWDEYQQALHSAESTSRFLRRSGRFPLTGRGDINTYAVFAELTRQLLHPRGRAGIIVPTGIATDATTQHFFRDVVEQHQLVSLYDFENRKALFPSVHRSYKFCLLTMAGTGDRAADAPLDTRHSPLAEFAFFCHDVADIHNPERRFTLSPEDFRLLNPNTRTAPIFRTRQDAELTKHIYRRVPVLVDESKGLVGNPWGVEFFCMIHMANDSHLFRTREQLEAEAYELEGNVFVRGGERYLPLYEAKMIWHFDHRFGDYRDQPEDSRSTQLPEAPPERLADPHYQVLPRYWVHELEVEACLEDKGWERGWLLGWRNITNVTNERTVIAAVIPRVGVGHSIAVGMSPAPGKVPCLGVNLSAFACDYVAKQKVGGTNLSFFIFEQLPVLPPEVFDAPCPWGSSGQVQGAAATLADWIRPRVLELTYTAWDLAPFAADLWEGADEAGRQAILRQWEENQRATNAPSHHPPLAAPHAPLPPFRYDAERRFRLRCELDAAFFILYLGTPAEWEREASPELKAMFPTPRDAVAYILDQFPIVKRRDEERFGTHRTRDTILSFYDALLEETP